MRICWTTVTAIALSSAAGCGLGLDGCDVQGRVTYQGKPVGYGTVLVADDQGKTVSTTLDPDGHYAATGVKAGTVRFAVVTSGPSGTVPPSNRKSETGSTAAPKSDSKQRVAVPKQYANPESSGLTTVINRGSNTFDIELK